MEDAPLPVWQSGQGLMDFFLQFAPHHLARRRVVAKIFAGWLDGFALLGLKRPGQTAPMPPPAAKLVAAQIAGDGEEPGRELAFKPEMRAVLKGLDEDLLGHILRFVLILQEAGGKPHDLLLIFGDKDVKRIKIAPRASHEECIFQIDGGQGIHLHKVFLM